MDEFETQQLFRICEEMAIHTARSLCSILSTENPCYGEHEGSGTYIKIGEQTFIVTAEHVIRRANRDSRKPAFTIGDQRIPLPLCYPVFTSEHPEADLAVIQIPNEALHGTDRVAVDLSFLAAASDENDNVLFIHGYPGEKSRFFALANGIVSTTLPYGTFSSPLLPPFSPQDHFAIQYLQENQQTVDGNRADLPHPGGLSGSAVWRSNQQEPNWNASFSKIIGIAIRYNEHSSSIVVTRVELLMDLLRAYYKL